MEKIKEIIYGLLIGIANVIPGASGGTIAVVTGVYDKMIDSIANVLSQPFKSIKNILFIGIGIALGLLVGILVISKLLEIAPLPTFFSFSGLIIGGIPFIFKKVEGQTKSPISWIVFIISMIIIFVLPFMAGGNGKTLEFNFISMFALFLLGVISLMTMILPGVSGSMVLTIFGYYESVNDLCVDTLKQLLNFEFTSNIILLMCFCLGAVVGLISFAKLIKFLLNKYFVNTFMCILGLVIASSFVIIILAIKDYGYDMILIAIPCLLVGIVGGYMLTKLERE